LVFILQLRQKLFNTEDVNLKI